MLQPYPILLSSGTDLSLLKEDTTDCRLSAFVLGRFRMQVSCRLHPKAFAPERASYSTPLARRNTLTSSFSPSEKFASRNAFQTTSASFEYITIPSFIETSGF